MLSGFAVNHPKGTKNESNSQHSAVIAFAAFGCKSP